MKKPPQHSSKKIRRTGTILLVAGIALIAISFLISSLFINGTGFKEEHRKRQYEQCLTRGTSADVCSNSFK